MERFNRLIALGAQEGFSDLHITGGHPVVSRKNGSIGFDKANRWSPAEVDALVSRLLNPRQLHMLKTRWSVDMALTIGNVRVRMNVFNTTRGLSLAIRLLPGTVPLIGSLNLHPSIQQMCKLKSGLILICGATGCGKSTTIAAMIEEINRTRAAHIISLEDPIEYRFLSNKSFIEQRELGAHMLSFEQGLLDVLREGPDVIVVGELREPQTMRLTLNAA
jgi:Tfp pilus assembly pilus retraction ATPase PilT